MQSDTPFRHLILTRFNCRFADRDFPARTQPGWLDSRFDLFERYCVPTLKAQTSQNFDWLVFFDSGTPEASLARARRVFEGYGNFHIRFLDVYTGDTLKADMRAFLAGAQPWLVTTRLDNDDGLNSAFVATLQRQLVRAQREALNFPYGIVLSDDRAYLSRQASNAFLSVSEPYENFGTALHAPHKTMDRHIPVRDLEGGPMWLQVIHESNVSNKRRGRRITRSGMPSGFEAATLFSNKPAPESATLVMLENLTLSVAWAGRDAAAQVYRRLRQAAR